MIKGFVDEGLQRIGMVRELKFCEAFGLDISES
jgi:hypothetical protein